MPLGPIKASACTQYDRNAASTTKPSERPNNQWAKEKEGGLPFFLFFILNMNVKDMGY
jgi:hypothetical protein